jgi:diadenosine tetraphosphate (Ap4A) HIT family hydrolase
MESMQPETPEDFYARVRAATGPDGRLAVAVEEMPGWDIFPFEIDSLRIKPLQPLAEAEPARGGEDPAECWCAGGPDPAMAEREVWSNDRWVLHLDTSSRLPIGLNLGPREHCDLPTVPDHLAGEMGTLIVAVAAAVEALPSVGRVQLAKYGDGGAHLHLFFFGRPARMLQLRGSPLLDWEENLPPVPAEVHRANAEAVAEHLLAAVGGTGPGWRRPGEVIQEGLYDG